LYGGSGSDAGWSIIPNTDGGYIIGGYCGSNDGDITGFHGGLDDIWLIKVDNNGGKLWSKTYGGPGNDFMLSLIAINNSLIFTGETTDNGGDFYGYIGGVGDGFIIKIKMPD